MNLSFRSRSFRASAPVRPANPDVLIAQLSRDKAALRDELEKAGDLIAYQRGRMKEQATENLGLLADRTYLAGLAERLMASMVRNLGVQLPPAPSTVDAASPQCAGCPHTRAQHDGWGCNAVFDGRTPCRCQVALVHFDKAKAVAS